MADHSFCFEHVIAVIEDESGNTVGSWCLICGTAVYDGERITDDGLAIGFQPMIRIQ
jgi:hypothetical protein